jgi:hypothetical protein
MSRGDRPQRWRIRSEKGRLPVIDVGDDREVADELRVAWGTDIVSRGLKVNKV